MKRLFQDSFIFGETTSSHFFRVTTSTQMLLFRSSYFFRGATFFEGIPFSEQSPLRSSHFFQNSYFLRAKLLPSSYFSRIGSSLGQLLFGTLTFLVEKLFEYSCTFSQHTFLEEIQFHSYYYTSYLSVSN